jgi:hypothetical protein
MNKGKVLLLTFMASVLLMASTTLSTQSVVHAQASGPVTAISELSDVQPTDWAFQALQSLLRLVIGL